MSRPRTEAAGHTGSSRSRASKHKVVAQQMSEKPATGEDAGKAEQKRLPEGTSTGEHDPRTDTSPGQELRPADSPESEPATDKPPEPVQTTSETEVRDGTDVSVAGQGAGDHTATTAAAAEASPTTSSPRVEERAEGEGSKVTAESDPDDSEDDNDTEQADSTEHSGEPSSEQPRCPSQPGAEHEEKTAVGGPAPAARTGPQPEQSLPQAPLELLAQLTNTPPPPETFARTIVRRLKVWTPIALALAAVLVAVQAVRPLPGATLELAGGASSYIFDGRFDIPWPEKGQGAVQAQGMGSLGTFGEQKPVPIASVAKVMTAYVLLKEHPLKKDEAGPSIEVDDKTVQDGMSEDESRVEGLTAGMKYSQQDMLKMLMIPSGNNIARLLARWDTGSDTETAFVRKMNDAAEALDMKNTRYTDPSGLDAKTVSTAVDQLQLAEAVMRFDAFRPVVAQPNATIEGLPQQIVNNNDNLLLAGLSITGIKTGSNTAAGGALMWAAYKTVDDKTPLILGTMLDQRADGPDPNGANSLTLVKDNSKKVIEAVRDALTSAVAVDKGKVVGYLDDGLGGRTPLVTTRDLKILGLPGHKLDLGLDDDGKALPHTAKAGTGVGVLTAGSGPDALQVPVALQKDLADPSFGSKLTRLG